jgi:hypothetical protein
MRSSPLTLFNPALSRPLPNRTLAPQAEDYSEVRVRSTINAIAEHEDEDDDDDVPQNEMDGPKAAFADHAEADTDADGCGDRDRDGLEGRQVRCLSLCTAVVPLAIEGRVRDVKRLIILDSQLCYVPYPAMKG